MTRMQQILNAYLGAIHSQLIPKELQPEFLAHVVITVCADHGGNNTKPAAARINYTQLEAARGSLTLRWRHPRACS
jgi:hypothetical protein